MQVLNYLLPLIAIILLAFLLLPAITKNTLWHATVTPLASIIGSGFLIAAPILGATVGIYTPLAMLGVVGIAYLIGGVIRFNIRYAEPLLSTAKPSSPHHLMEHVSSLALFGAYVISVAFYLRLMSSFVLRGFGVLTDVNAQILTTLVLLFIGAIGWWRGLKVLEWLEEYSVSIKLAIIGAFLIGLATYGVSVDFHYALPPGIERSMVDTLRVLAGMLLVVQGFETSRYLGAEYDANTRIRSMRLSQILAGGIYLIFAFLILPLIGFLLTNHPDETAIIDLSNHVSVVLPLMLIVAATMSQFSAAIADTLGGGGILAEESQGKISAKTGYLLIVIAAIYLVWNANVFEIVAIASRAFGVYYFTQSVIAIRIAFIVLEGPRKWLAVMLYSLVAVFLIGVVIFAIPAG